MRNLLIAGVLLSAGALLPVVEAGKKKAADEDKEGLYALQEFIGGSTLR